MDSEHSTGSGTSKVHSMAVSGFTKNSAKHYDLARPYYTEQTIDEIIKRTQVTGLESTANVVYDVLELGAGTGKFTQKLYPRIKQMNIERNKPFKYLATDPSEGFLNTLQQNLPDVETSIASADCLKLPEHSVRLVVAAQCFHWFATEEALKEIYRVLVPDGMLVLVWNRADVRLPWIKAACDHLVGHYPANNVPREASEEWKKVFESFPNFQQQFYAQPSGPVIQGMKSVINYFMSVSVIASLTDEEKQKVKNSFIDLLNDWFPGIMEETPLDYPFQTHLYGFVKD